MINVTRLTFFLLTTIALLGPGCGGDAVMTDAAPACTPGPVTVAVTGQATYACHDPFRAMVTVTNKSCQAVTVQTIMVTGTVTSGNCTPPGPGSFRPMVAGVPVGSTTQVADITGGKFCCFAQACPASFQCDEKYDYTVMTSAGALTASTDSHLSLDGCSEICATP